MSSIASEPDAPRDAECRLDVATTAADTLRANVRVTGSLDRDTTGVLVGILRTHVRVGRRYLRVDLAESQLTDPSAVSEMRALHDQVQQIGGMLIFENLDMQSAAAARDAVLFVRASEG